MSNNLLSNQSGQYKIVFISLGCDKNRINTEQMMSLVQDAGHEIVYDPCDADVCVINTCGFIDAAKEEGIANILEMAKLKADGKLSKILVTGCLSQRYREEIKESLPEVDGLLGTGSYTDIVQAINDVMQNTMPEYYADMNTAYDDGLRVITTEKYFAYLKIAEGCNNRCAFCAIPKIRGKYRSRTMENVLEEAEYLSSQGVKELILIAQNVSHYGMDLYHKRMLPELLKELCKLDFHWIRLHYIYPDDFTDELLDVIANEPKIVNYFDIPLQHCNGTLLRSMHRWGNRERITELLDKIRAKIPDAVFRTSLITGLPGETDEMFDELCEFLREQKLVRAGVFQFSPEEGTLAVTLPNQIAPEIAEKRLELLIDLQSDIIDEYNESRLGETLEVIVEGFDEDIGCWRGRTYADAPDVDDCVYFAIAGTIESGSFVNIHLTDTIDGSLYGEIED